MRWLGSGVGAVASGVFALALYLMFVRTAGPTSELTVALATPGARLVSFVTGWPMESELGPVCYVLGLAVTMILMGMIVGGVVGWLGGAARSRRAGRARGDR